jgi:hypothetical protein
MASIPQTGGSHARAAVQALVLDVLRRRAAGESLSDDQVIADRPELAEQLRAEFEKLQRICAAEVEADARFNAETVTADFHAAQTPGTLCIHCPHCREPFQATQNSPVSNIVCSACGGHF